MTLSKFYGWFVLLFSILICIFYGLCDLSTRIQDVKTVKHRKVAIFRVDDSFTKEEQEAIASALWEWEIASGGYFQFGLYIDNIDPREVLTWSEDGIMTIYNASSFLSWELYIGRTLLRVPGAIGMATLYPGDIFVFSTSLQSRQLEKLIIHEVGHLLGVPHSKDPKSVMYHELFNPRAASLQGHDVETAKEFHGSF